MRSRISIVALFAASLAMLAGCLGSFAANQSRRQAARSADYYVKTYAEPELNEYYGNPQDTRQMRNDMADTIVRAGNERQVGRVGVDDRGWLTKEDR